jgi:hypothetical protein
MNKKYYPLFSQMHAGWCVFTLAADETGHRFVSGPHTDEESAEQVAASFSRGFTYLAGPYTHPSATVRLARYNGLTAVAGKLMRRGAVVYSPVTMGHAIHNARACGLPTGWDEFWREQSLVMLAGAGRLAVLQLAGWRESIGVMAEIEFAIAHGIPIDYL